MSGQQDETMWWEIVSALGSAGAAVVAVLLGLTGWAANWAARKRERLRRAALVSAWVETSYVPNVDRSGYVPRAMAFVANESDEPVFQMHAMVGLGLPPDVVQLGTLGMPDLHAVVPPRTKRSWDITRGIMAHSTSVQMGRLEPVCRISFTDAEGSAWLRDWDGKVTRVMTSKKLKSETRTSLLDPNPDRAQEQLGPVEEGVFNPMLTAVAFFWCLVDESKSTSAEDMKRTLLAPGKDWRDFDEKALDELRKEVVGYGLAANCRFGAPQVAYAYFPYDDDVREEVAIGSYSVENMKVVTLIFLPKLGWRIFAFGSHGIRPDWIAFPKRSIVDDPREGMER